MKKEFSPEKRPSGFNTGTEIKVYQNFDYEQHDSFLFVEQAGITEPSPDYYIEHTKNSRYYNMMFIFEYVISGKGYIECEGECYEVRAGDFYFLNRLHEHKYYADKKDPFKKIWLNLSGSLIVHLVSLFDMDKGVVIARENVKDVFEDIHRLLVQRPEEWNRRVAVLLFELFTRVSKERFSYEYDPKRNLPARIKRYIDKNIYNSISVSGLTAKFYFSKAYITRIFRDEYGITPKQYMQERRIAVAKSLLADSDNSIAVIADKLNYTDSKHFANAFREAEGCSPSEYRKANQK